MHGPEPEETLALTPRGPAGARRRGPALLAGLLLPGLLLGSGCEPGKLTCGDRPCRLPGDGGLLDGGGGPPRDQGPLLPDLRQEIDLPPPVDLGEPCPVGPWPRLARPAQDHSGGSGGQLGDSEITITADGSQRRVLLHVPRCEQPGARYGLVVALADADGNREYLRYKWVVAAAARGYVVALPEALPSYGGRRNWLENAEANRATVLATVLAVEQLFPIERQETLLTGLGVGATFGNDLALADTTDTFEGLLLVNGTLWDPTLEARGRKSFILLGDKPAAHLAARPSSDYFRYLFVPGLGPYYPGPAWASLSGDREVPEIDPTAAVDWFWP